MPQSKEERRKYNREWAKKQRDEMSHEEKEEAREKARIRYRENRDRILQVRKEWVAKNPDKGKEASRRSYRKNKEEVNLRSREKFKNSSEEQKQSKRDLTKQWKAKNKEKVAEYQRRWMSQNRDKVLKYRERSNPKRASRYREKMREDPNFSLVNRLRARTLFAVKKAAANKQAPTMKLLGCSISELRSHLESHFLPGMSWERLGEIHIDHHIPIASFDLTNPDEQRRCFHFSNLRPMWGTDNIKKGAKMPEQPAPLDSTDSIFDQVMMPD